MEENKKYRLIVPQKLILLQKEDKELQKEQNRILIWNTKLAVWATLFALLAFLAQTAQIIVDIILIKFSK